MITRKTIALIIASGLFLLVNCKSSDGGCSVTVKFNGESIRYCPDNPEDESVTLDRAQDEFIWQAMNLFYYWQEDVANLADKAFADYDDLHLFLNGFNSSESLFYNGLLSPEDRFSWIVDDYVELEQSFQGISPSFGYRIAVVSEDEIVDTQQTTNRLVGFVQYVEPGGPADLAGLDRGKLFNTVDGTQLTFSNVSALLNGRDSYQLNAIDLVNGDLITLEETYSLARVEVVTDPIFENKVLDVGGLKIGYLAYNQFIFNNSRHQELNTAFGDFKSQGIDELVLDLRYNPGGSVTTTRILSSMILGNQTDAQNLGSIVYNSKLNEYFSTPLKFFEQLPVFDEAGDIASNITLNRLTNLTRIFILTGQGSASASELVIAGLDPYIEVIQIGDVTVGKNQGSVTLYDTDKPSLFLDSEQAEINPNHTYAIQPIISKLSNSEGLTDYEEGLFPDIYVYEAAFLDDLKPLGDPGEPLLARALEVITGAARSLQRDAIKVEAKEILNQQERRLQTTVIEAPYIPKELFIAN